MAERAITVIESLGGVRVTRRKSRRRQEDLRLALREGLPATALNSIMETWQISEDDLVRQLGVSPSTLRRRRENGRLSPVESDRLYRLASAPAKAEAVFGNRAKAVRWLHSSNRALQGETPLSVLDTDIGAQRLRDVLGRLEHGVYS